MVGAGRHREQARPARVSATVSQRGRDPGRRERVFQRDGFRCVYCGSVFEADDLTVDHVQPRMRGGDTSAGNLVTACRACNTAKGSLPAWAFLAGRRQQRENFLKYATAVWARHRRAVEEAAEDAPSQ